MRAIPYRPHTDSWEPGAVYAALTEFYSQEDRRSDALDALVAKVSALGHATVLKVQHDKNEVPHLSEILCATFIIDHDTGTVLGWCDEFIGHGLRGRPDVMVISTAPSKQSTKEVDQALRAMARVFKLFALPINWYNVFPLSMFLYGSREEFVRYLNRLHQLGCI